MITRLNSASLRGAVVVALSTCFSMLCSAQGTTSVASNAASGSATVSSTGAAVYTNPRSSSDDPRVGLKAGLYDAGTAASGMELLITVPKPAGFAPDADAIAAFTAAPTPAPGTRPTAPRGPAPYGSTNSDLAFRDKYLFVGNYNGINFYDISNPAKISLVTSIICPGGQGDVSVYGHLLFMSVEAANGRLDCGTQGFPTPAGAAPAPPPDPGVPGAAPGAGGARMQRPPDPASPDRIKGIRIFDISDIRNPKQIKDVQTCRGSHTHTLVIDPKDKDNVYIYISGSAPVRATEELSGCSGGDPDKDPSTAVYTIVVIKVPVAHPEEAKVVNSPRIFQDEATGNANGLWKGGNHGEGTQTTSATRGCHDITVRSDLGLAAGACSGNGILLDISDVAHPKRIDAVSDPNYAFWHSANFSNDGTKVLFTDEWGGGGQPRCRETDPMNWGADALFNLKDRKLTLASYYKMPAPQTELENCVAHNGSLIPVPGRDIEVQSWYQGGISIVDFTDITHPVEIGYFDRGPVNGTKRAMGGQWSTYWYNGYIYGSEIARGVDVLQLVPSKYLTQNEIDAAKLVQVQELNVQNQQKFVWPANYTIARAYLDQLSRDNALPAEKITALNAAIDSAERSHSKKQLKKMAAGVEKDAASTKSSADAARLRALAGIMKSA